MACAAWRSAPSQREAISASCVIAGNQAQLKAAIRRSPWKTGTESAPKRSGESWLTSSGCRLQ